MDRVGNFDLVTGHATNKTLLTNCCSLIRGSSASSLLRARNVAFINHGSLLGKVSCPEQSEENLFQRVVPLSGETISYF
jgi:hypothetical protein